MNVKKLLSKPVHTRLTKTLLSIEMAKTPSDMNNAYDTLREQLTNLFSLRHIGQYPNQVMVDFAETIQGLYSEKDDLEGYLYHIRNYLYRGMRCYDKTYQQLTRQAHLARKRVNIDPIELLDIEYQAWTYSHGYYKQQYEMYQYLVSILDQVLQYNRARVKS